VGKVVSTVDDNSVAASSKFGRIMADRMIGVRSGGLRFVAGCR
jgi:hypothetical protein